MTANQQAALRRITTALDHRYMQMNGGLCDAINIIEKILDSMDEGNPAGDQVSAALSLLVIAASEAADLQSAVLDILRNKLAQVRSAKVAYEQGWDARLIDLLSQATPIQAAEIRKMLLDAANDDQIPF